MPARLYVLDTNMLVFMIRALNPRRPASPHRAKAERIVRRIHREVDSGATIGVSALTVSELEYGAGKSEHPVKERQAVSKVLAPFQLFDYDAVNAPRHYGEIRGPLETDGAPIGAMDLLIAAHARALGAVLVTNNADEFARIEGLSCQDWCE